MNNSYSVEAVLKATGADQFASDFDKAKKSLGGMEGATKKSAGGLKRLAGGIAKVAGGIGVTKLISAGFNAIRNSIDGAVSRVDTLNQFPRVLEQMGYSTDEATKATDRLSEGIQGLPTRLDEVVGTTQRFVTAFGDVDLATESTLALNNALLASGADAQGAANATDQYVKMLSSGKLEMDTWNTLSEQMSYALSEVAKDLGIADGDIWKLYDSLQAGDITLDQFNQAMIDASNETGGFAETALTASEGIRTSWTNIQTAVTTGVANAIQAINDWMKDAGLGGISEQFDRVKVAVQEAFGYIVEQIPVVLDHIKSLFTTVSESTAFQSLKEVIGEVIETGKELIQQFLQSEAWANFKDLLSEVAQAILDIDFRQLAEDVAQFVEKWAPLIAGIMGAVAAFKIITGVMAAVAAVKATLAAAAGALSLAIAGISWPILLVVAVIGALIAAGVWLWQNWDTVKEKAQQLGDKISEIWTSIKEWTSNAWETVKTTITETVTTVWNAIVEWFGQLPQWFSDTWNSIVETVSIWVSNMIDKAIEVGTQFLENIVTFFSELPYNVGYFLGTVIGTVVQWAIDMGTKAYETGSDFLTSLIDWFKQLPGRVWDWVTTTYKRVQTWAINMRAKAIETGMNFLNSIIDWFSRLPGRIQTWLSNVIGKVSAWATDLWSKGKEAGRKLVEAVITTVRELPGKIVSAGKDVVRGFWNGITSMGSWIKNKVSNFFGGIVDGVKSTLKIFSPSRVFRDDIGEMIVKGFGLGIERNEKEAINPMNRMLDNVIGVFDSQTSGLGATFSVTGEGNIARAMNRALDVDMPMMNGQVNHSVNMNSGRMESLLEQLVNSNQVIVLDSGELVGATYPQYDRVGGNQTQLTERWGR